jgi:carbon-monoxide dehydrogenase large subunit
MSLHYIGKPVLRIDGLDKVTGRAAYTVDINLPGLLHGAVLRSPMAHARIRDIDVSQATHMPGVRAVITGHDVPYTFGGIIKDQPFLAAERIRYAGEPVVAIAAETELQAQNALCCVRVTYEELPAVFDPREALAANAPLLHPKLENYVRNKTYEIIPGTNVCTVRTYSFGDVERGFAEADEIIEDEYYIHAVAHTPMETHAAVAQYFAAKSEFTVWSSTDRPYRMAKEMADAFGVSTNQVRFISMYGGGGFGGKGSLVAEAIAACLARFTKGRPVRVVYSREEEITATQTRHATFFKLKTGVQRDGTFTAWKADIVVDNGAYASWGPDVAARGILTVFGPYRIPNLELLSRLVYTNKQIAGAYRGFGSTQATWACEAHMDVIAAKLGIDPFELRMKNAYVDGDCYINGQMMSRVGLKQTLTSAAQKIGWGQPKPAPNGSKVRGKGIGVTIKPTKTPTASYCFIRVNLDGTVSLLSGAPEIGAGEKTVLAQIAAETIGVPLSVISVPNPDTHYTPYDTAVASSRTTYHMGNAVRMAGLEVRQKILYLAAKALKTDAEKLNLLEGKILDASGSELITLQALLAKALGPMGGSILGEGYYSAEGSPLLASLPGLEGLSSIFWMFATHIAEVEVDVETGVVKVVKVVASHDVGRVINPVSCEQQIEGAVIMGLSNTLFEEFKMEKGRIVNGSLADYKIATIMDLPEIDSMMVESIHEEGPYGAKGVGEPAAAPTAPAIANAIYDAIGVRLNELPITPEKILAALRAKQSNG